ncbi:Acetyltransferase YpeA [Anoxybacillus sp. BCO1]|nr:Acetyltransferase YpeA [Anoxybacillus sp. BCO1]
MNIRHATVDDAERLAALILQVESESDYLLFEAGERKLTPEQQRSHLEAITNEDNTTILLAETDEGELVGYLLARGGFARRNRHSVYIVIGLLAAFRGKGMGTMLLTELERWAREKGVRRLELTVVVDNALRFLYTKRWGLNRKASSAIR